MNLRGNVYTRGGDSRVTLADLVRSSSDTPDRSCRTAYRDRLPPTYRPVDSALALSANEKSETNLDPSAAL